MSEQVSVEVGPSGGPVAVKRRDDEEGRSRLRHEAEMLELARGPGVVELVAFDDGDSGTALSTSWLGGGTFATATLPPRKLAVAGAALALTVASLHERSVVHGRITADHVLLDSSGRLVLAGFAESAVDAGPDDLAADVRSIGELVASKLPSEPPPVLKLRAQAADADLIERVRAVAARATEPDPSRRPSARSLAGLLSELAGDATASGPMRLGRPAPARQLDAPHPLAPALDAATAMMTGARSTVALRALGGAACLALVVTVGLGARAALAGGESSAPPIPAVTTAFDVTAAPATTAVTRVWPTTSAMAPSCVGVRCGEAVIVEAGVIRVGDRRYDIGEPGDSISVADWDCDGLDTAALVRPDTGEVYVFDSWPTADAPLTARLVDRVSDAAALDPPDADCRFLVVVRRDGTRARITLDGAPR